MHLAPSWNLVHKTSPSSPVWWCVVATWSLHWNRKSDHQQGQLLPTIQRGPGSGHRAAEDFTFTTWATCVPKFCVGNCQCASAVHHMWWWKYWNTFCHCASAVHPVMVEHFLSLCLCSTSRDGGTVFVTVPQHYISCDGGTLFVTVPLQYITCDCGTLFVTVPLQYISCDGGTLSVGLSDPPECETINLACWHAGEGEAQWRTASLL